MRPDWKSIETAPKDSAILLCIAGFEPCVGRWVPVQDMIPGTMYELTPLGEKEGVWVGFDWEGHFEDDEALLSYCNATGYEPTHWTEMPETAEPFED